MKKNIFKGIMVTICLTAFLFLFFPRNVYAYLDAGTGSYIIQMAIAAFVGGIYVMKQFWRRIAQYITNLFSVLKKHD